MELAVLLLLLLVFLVGGLPIAFALAGASFALILMIDIPLVVAVQRMMSSINSFSFMAIPFFIFAGDLMYRSGIAERLVNLVDAIFGRGRGGLGQVNIGSSMMFGAVSGSPVASVSAIGSVVTPMMLDKGYDRDYIVNVTSTAAVTGLLIPPSHNMIIYAAAAGTSVSIGNLFLAGIVPGVITGGLLMLAAWVVASKRSYPRGMFPGLRSLVLSATAAIPGLMSAVIIFAGILSGIFTATESSAIAVVYTVLVAVFVYRSLDWASFTKAVLGSVKTTSVVMMVIGSAAAFGWLFALLEGPSELARLLLLVSDNPIILLLLVNLVLLLLGTFMDMAPLIIIMTPIFLPIVGPLGVDPVQFGIIMMLNLGIGLVTPPVGSVLFVGCAIGKIAIEQTIKTIWPFYIALLAALMMITFIPDMTLALPELFGA